MNVMWRLVFTSSIVYALIPRCIGCGFNATLQPNSSLEVSSPNYGQGQKYPNDVTCLWKITTSSPEIQIEIIDFELEDHAACYWDYLEIFTEKCEGAAVKKLCGHLSHTLFKFNNKIVCLRFKSDKIVQKRGFKVLARAAETGESACGVNGLKVIHSPTNITSPNFGTNMFYPVSIVCKWKIDVPPGKRALLNFIEFDLENQANCQYDNVTIFNGTKETDLIIQLLCGSNKGMQPFVSDNSFLIKFTSDHIVTRKGFKAMVMYENVSSQNTQETSAWSSVESSTVNVFSTLTENNYLVTSLDSSNSPKYISFTPPSTAVKSLSTTFEGSTSGLSSTLLLPTGNVALENSRTLSFSSYNLGSEELPFTTVAIPVSTSTATGIESHLDSNEVHQTTSTVAVSASPSIITSPVSDSLSTLMSETTSSVIIVNGNTMENFSMCDVSHVLLEQETGYIFSPTDGTGNLYPLNIQCSLLLESVNTTNIKLVFEEFNVEQNYMCLWDNLTIYDGQFETDTNLGTYCGTNLPATLTSSLSRLLLLFKSDYIVQRTGFKIKYSLVLSENGTPQIESSTYSVSPTPPSVSMSSTSKENSEQSISLDSISQTAHIPSTILYYTSHPVLTVSLPSSSYGMSARSEDFTTLSTDTVSHAHSTILPVNSNDFSINESSTSSVTATNSSLTSIAPTSVKETYQFSSISTHMSNSDTMITTSISVPHLTLSVEPTSSVTMSTPKTYKNISVCADTHAKLDYESGYILSPVEEGTANLYPLNVKCGLLIESPTTATIQLVFEEFDIEQNSMCQWDNLTIYDGTSVADSHFGTYCGTTLPPVLVSSQSRLYLLFVSDHIVQRTGFRIQYNILNSYSAFPQSTPFLHSASPAWSTTVTIASETVKANYMTSVQIENSVLADATSALSYQQVSSALPTTTESYLSTSDLESLDSFGDSVPSASHEFVVSQSTVPGHIIKSTSALSQIIGSTSSVFDDLHSSTGYTTFTTPASSTTTPFTRPFSILMCSTTSATIGDNGSIIRSPNYGKGKLYPLQQNCHLRLKSSQNKKLRLTFLNFDVESHQSCKWDRLVVYDGRDSKSDVLGEFCGNKLFDQITSSSNSMYLDFTSDSSVNRPGFQIKVEITGDAMSTPVVVDICEHNGDNISVDRTINLVSPGYVSKQLYPLNVICGISLSAVNTKKLVVTFIDFEIEEHNTCKWDSLEINGAAKQSLLKFCGRDTPDVIVSEGSQMYFKFTSDYIVKKRGFSIIVSSVKREQTQFESESGLFSSETEIQDQTQLYTSSKLSSFKMDNDVTVTSCIFSTPDSSEDKPSSTLQSSTSLLVQSPLTEISGQLPSPVIQTSPLTSQTFSVDTLSSKEYSELGTLISPSPTKITLSSKAVLNESSRNSMILSSIENTKISSVFNETVSSLLSSSTGGIDNADDSSTSEILLPTPSVYSSKTNGMSVISTVLMDSSGIIDLATIPVDPLTEDIYKWTITAPASQRIRLEIVINTDVDNSKRASRFRRNIESDIASSDNDENCMDKGIKIFDGSNEESNLLYNSSSHVSEPFAVISSGAEIVLKYRVPRPQCNSTFFAVSYKSQSNCGVRKLNRRKRIVGGTVAREYSWPWMVALWSGDNFLCGGTLITTSWIITAGHCIYNFVYRPHVISVRMGSTKHRDLNITSRAAEVLTHPDFNFVRNADIGLLKIKDPPVLNDHIYPACLPEVNQTTDKSWDCYIAGWGVTSYSGFHTDDMEEELRETNTNLWSQDECVAAYPDMIKQSMLCAGVPFKDACKGDSGGPLICETADGRYNLTGITSWGKGCGQLEKPGVYTRVSHYVDWIHKIINYEGNNVNCTFENANICGYKEISSGPFMWIRQKPSSFYYGFDFGDHTFYNASGHYMLVHTTLSGDDGTANLISPVISSVPNTKCLSFAFVFIGQSTISLSVISNHKPVWKIFHLNGPWHSTNITLQPDVKHIEFQANKGSNDAGGLAIDDVSVNDGPCKDLSKYSCDFNSGDMCLFKQSHYDDGDWILYQDPGYGAYMFVDGISYYKYRKIDLMSPELTVSITRCLNFYYKIQNGGQLSVVPAVENNQHIFHYQVIWTNTDVQMDNWTLVKVTVPAVSENARIIFRATISDQSNKFALDNIKIHDGHCI